MTLIFEFLSLWWTFPAIATSVLLLLRYGPLALASSALIFKGRHNELKPAGWISTGIAICFAGSIVDNAYWFIAWAIRYTTGGGNEFFDFGVFMNVPFRQVPLIAGAILHTLAEIAKTRKSHHRARKMLALKRTVWISTVVGFVVMVILTLVRSHTFGL